LTNCLGSLAFCSSTSEWVGAKRRAPRVLLACSLSALICTYLSSVWLERLSDLWVGSEGKFILPTIKDECNLRAGMRMKDEKKTRGHGDAGTLREITASPCRSISASFSSFILHPSSLGALYSFTIYKTPTWEKEPDEVDHTRTVCGYSDDSCGMR